MRSLNDERVAYLSVNWQHIAALVYLFKVDTALARAVHIGVPLIGSHVDTRAKCALLAGLDAADGLSPLATFGRGRAVIQAHRRFAWLKELLEVGVSLYRRHDVTVSEQLLEALCRALD